MSRRLVAAVAIVAATACGTPETSRGPASPKTTAPGETRPPAAAGRTPAAGDEPHDPTAPEPDRTAPGPAHAARSDDGGEVGSNAPLYLNRRFRELVVEVDAVAGLEPSGSLLELLRARLAQVVDKPGGIVFVPAETIPGQSDGVWTVDDLAASARSNRDRFSGGDTMVMYLQFVDGRFEDEGAFAVAYSASEVAMFVDHMRDAATLLVGASALERAALIHELGHLLSLVNLGYTSPRDREDPAHPKHSTNPDSVMFWAVDNVGILTLLGGRAQPPTAFDADDLADLADVRAGRLG
jgi:hypothetical protein